MNSTQPPLPPLLRWLAVIPAIIMAADYAFLAPSSTRSNPPAAVVAVATSTPVSQPLAKTEPQSIPLTSASDLSF